MILRIPFSFSEQYYWEHRMNVYSRKWLWKVNTNKIIKEKYSWEETNKEQIAIIKLHIKNGKKNDKNNKLTVEF